MKLATRCFPLGMLPYDSIESTTRMFVKLYEKLPYLPFLPNVSKEDTIISRTLDNIPGIKIKDSKVKIKIASNHYKQGMSRLEKAFNHPSLDNLEYFAFSSPFLEKYLQFIKKFESPNAVINLLGPFTISQILENVAEEEMLVDKTYRKLFIQAVCVKALWFIEKVKSVSPNTIPIIILEEPMLSQLGTLKRENEEITEDLVTGLLSKVVEKIKSAGALVAVQSMEKCNWQVPINAGVDIISFDAYNNPNNLSIFPEEVTKFIERGGKINWGIVPVMNETMVKSLNVDDMSRRLYATFDGLIMSGVPSHLVYNSAMVSVQGNVDHLAVIFAEKALMVATQLAQRIPVKTVN